MQMNKMIHTNLSNLDTVGGAQMGAVGRRSNG